MAEWPRQPRLGCMGNQARRNSVGNQHWIQLRNCSGSWVNAFYVTTSSRADIISSRLNSIFQNYPGADLDFITPSWENGSYVVVWSQVVWFQNQSHSTVNGGGGRTYENLYAGCVSSLYSYPYRSRTNVHIIATVTNDDIQAYGANPWEMALQWANSIRSPMNGWNCTKDAVNTTLYCNGQICQLTTPTSSYSDSSLQLTATYYGAGETLPSFFTGNYNVFHTCDLTVARPANRTWPYNSWIRVTANNVSVVARVIDVSDINSIDLSSGGVAYALGYPNQVTVSAP